MKCFTRKSVKLKENNKIQKLFEKAKSWWKTELNNDKVRIRRKVLDVLVKTKNDRINIEINSSNIVIQLMLEIVIMIWIELFK